MNTVKKIKEFKTNFTYQGKTYLGTVRCIPDGDREILVCLDSDRDLDASEEVYNYFFNLLEWYGII